MFLFLCAYLELVSLELHIARDDFAAVYNLVRKCPVARDPVSSEQIEEVISTMNTACIWYWKEVLCLQRSAATARLLKKHGVLAEMVIGARQIPFRAHAWVEVRGRVVNDKPYTPELYNVIDRC